jgi:flagellar hook-basal body complex protein FliE
MRIHPLAGRNEFALPSATPGAAEKQGDDFAKTLMDVLKEVNVSQADAREMQNAFMTGQPVDIADVKIAMERASIALNLTMQVRNKLLEAYQEINRMQV